MLMAKARHFLVGFGCWVLAMMTRLLLICHSVVFDLRIKRFNVFSVPVQFAIFIALFDAGCFGCVVCYFVLLSIFAFMLCKIAFAVFDSNRCRVAFIYSAGMFICVVLLCLVRIRVFFRFVGGRGWPSCVLFPLLFLYLCWTLWGCLILVFTSVWICMVCVRVIVFGGGMCFRFLVVQFLFSMIRWVCGAKQSYVWEAFRQSRWGVRTFCTLGTFNLNFLFRFFFQIWGAFNSG